MSLVILSLPHGCAWLFGFDELNSLYVVFCIDRPFPSPSFLFPASDIMAASVAGSAFGGDAQKRRRTSNAHAAIRADSAVASGLAGIAAQRRAQDLSYVLECLQQADEELIITLATLLRSGTLGRALNMASQKQMSSDEAGDMIPAKLLTFGALYERHYNIILAILEPQIFSEEVLTELTRSEKKELVLFALGLSHKCNLPSCQDPFDVSESSWIMLPRLLLTHPENKPNICTTRTINTLRVVKATGTPLTLPIAAHGIRCRTARPAVRFLHCVRYFPKATRLAN
jgi:hypothetical protein